MRRAVISGLGVISPLGSDPGTVWKNVVAVRSGIGPLTRIKLDGTRAHVAGEVQDYRPEAHFEPAELELLDRFAQLAIVAARAACKDAGLEFKEQLAERTGVSIGSAYGGAETYDSSYHCLYADKAQRLHPLTIPRLMHNAATSQVSKYLNARGPCLSVSTACASSAHAIGEAFRTIRAGAADVMIAGGSDAAITLGVIRCWEAMRVLASAGTDPSSACRPFSIDREGLVLGEGAAMLVLEDYDRACRRNAPIYAEVVGYGSTSDAGHVTQPSVEGPARAMQHALREAALSADQVDYINAHGTGTRVNDVIETRAIRQVFKSASQTLSVSSTKSLHGHLMGASGAMELLIAVLGMQNSTIPPTANYHGRDPECDLDNTPNEPRPRRIRAALSNSFAFGGLNAVLAVREV
jgi:beta-ketoacyl-acyl-carrier-protein synthase II